jgi:branched-chain amino acid transport system permease protein
MVSWYTFTMFWQQIIANILITASIYGLLAIGFNFIYSTVKFFDLSFAIIPVVGAYMVLLFAKLLGFPLWIAIALGIIIPSILALLFYTFVYKPLKERKSSTMVFLVASLGLYTIILSIIPIFFSSQFQTLSNTVTVSTIAFGNAIVTNIQVITISLFIAIGLLLALILKKTRFGKAVRATADDEEVTKTMGINTHRIIQKVFIIGGAIGALAGIMVGMDTGIDPYMGFHLLLKGVIAAIIGGVGNIYAGIVGAIVLASVENIGVWYFSAQWKDLIAFTVLILFLIIRPFGIFKK